MIENPLKKQEINLIDKAEIQEQLPSKSRYKNLIIIKNIFIVLISIIFQILEIIFQIIIFFECKEYEEYKEKNNSYFKGLGTIIIGFVVFVNVSVSIIVGITYYIFSSKYKSHYGVFFIILLVKSLFIFISIQAYYKFTTTIMYIIFIIFEAFYFIICLIYIIIYISFQKNTH